MKHTQAWFYYIKKHGGHRSRRRHNQVVTEIHEFRKSKHNIGWHNYCDPVHLPGWSPQILQCGQKVNVDYQVGICDIPAICVLWDRASHYNAGSENRKDGDNGEEVHYESQNLRVSQFQREQVSGEWGNKIDLGARSVRLIELRERWIRFLRTFKYHTVKDVASDGRRESRHRHPHVAFYPR